MLLCSQLSEIVCKALCENLYLSLYNAQRCICTCVLPGFKDLHNFAFLGPNPRIGCASDFVFAYVPFGPIQQLKMFFHSVDCCRKGMEKVRCNQLMTSFFGRTQRTFLFAVNELCMPNISTNFTMPVLYSAIVSPSYNNIKAKP